MVWRAVESVEAGSGRRVGSGGRVWSSGSGCAALPGRIGSGPRPGGGERSKRAGFDNGEPPPKLKADWGCRPAEAAVISVLLELDAHGLCGLRRDGFVQGQLI
jgi:hypothetical protein